LRLPGDLQEQTVSASEQPAQLYDGELMLGPHGELNAEQVAATLARERPLLLEASAGAGKTLVLVERFVRDVLEGDSDGHLLECDQILAITFTRKAAAELRERIRRRFAELAPGNQRAREAVAALDGAWISTIDGFCARLLRRHALLVGVDPSFVVIDEVDLIGYRNAAFGEAAERVLSGDRADQALELFAADWYDKLKTEITRIYDQMRSAGNSSPRLGKVEDGSDHEGWVTLLDDLLVAYGEQFAALKRADGGCDFADVVFAARDLLVDHPAVAASYRESFKRILIDEFQDTNGLQLELFEALGISARFQVGDPLQAIYGWRHADLQLFIDAALAHELDGHRLRQTHNYRSRPEILQVINAAFSEVHVASGVEWTAIAGGSDDEPVGDPPYVELLFTDSVAWKGDDLAGDRAEARLVASRIKRLIDSGEAGQGEVVVLMESRSAMSTYREELLRLGLDAVSDGGENWWQRIEVVDLLAHLRLLANRADEGSLLAALRSPLCAIGLDALALIGGEKARDQVRSMDQAFENCAALEREPGSPAAAICSADHQKLIAYRQLLRDWTPLARELSVGDLLEQVIDSSSYAAILLAGEDGEQKLANVRQLAAMAHAWDLRHGASLRAFLAWVDEASGPSSQETDAPVGGAIDTDGKPDPDGPVRLMTIHASKGLEYPVVVVPRLGGGVRRDDAMIRVEGNQVSCSLKAAGSDGNPAAIGPYEEMKAAAELKGHYERRRKIHVAITRAERRLILSGTGKSSGPWNVDETATRSGCLSWMIPGLLGTNAVEILEQGGEQVIKVEGDGAAGLLQLVVSVPERAGELFEEPPRSETEASDGQEIQFPKLPDAAAPSIPVPATISYSQLSRLAECSYRWYLERVVGLPAREEDSSKDDSRGARARGTLTHQLLEMLTFEKPERIPSDDEIKAAARTVDGARSDRDAIGDQREMLEAFVASSLWAELAEAKKVERESNFSIEIVADDNTLPVLTGAIDVIAQLDSAATLVVDYKTDSVGKDEDLSVKVEERYHLQRDAYALAALRRGASEVEVVYYFLARPDERISATFTRAEEAALEQRLREAAMQLTGSEFPVSAAPHRGLCRGCPGRPVGSAAGLCSHSEAETSRAR
jgi:ATP-dependent exoDNAse (exonuclease V) beta subunit